MTENFIPTIEVVPTDRLDRTAPETWIGETGAELPYGTFHVNVRGDCLTFAVIEGLEHLEDVEFADIREICSRSHPPIDAEADFVLLCKPDRDRLGVLIRIRRIA